MTVEKKAENSKLAHYLNYALFWNTQHIVCTEAASYL